MAAYRAALKEWTRERGPLQWAGTQNNLGTALQTLGARLGDPTLLREALALARNAYEFYVKEAGYAQYEAYFTNRIDAIQTDLDALSHR